MADQLQLCGFCLEIVNALQVLVDPSLRDVQLVMRSSNLGLQLCELPLQVIDACAFLSFFTQQLLDLRQNGSLAIACLGLWA